MQPKQSYSNFVKASPSSSGSFRSPLSSISGEKARLAYLEEISKANNSRIKSAPRVLDATNISKKKRHKIEVNDKDLFLAAQNNDFKVIHEALDDNLERLHLVDDYGWSLLMIACQANSVEVVKELLDRGISTSVRDKAGNSALTLVIKNKNIELADMIVNRNKLNSYSEEKGKGFKRKKVDEQFECLICNLVYSDKEQHLSSTIHNINASKGKKITSSYKIPESNKGFQIMVKSGWNKDSGLGQDGNGRRYPIRPIEKKDRKGLGHKISKNKHNNEEINEKHKNKSKKSDSVHTRSMEINFRRAFY